MASRDDILALLAEHGAVLVRHRKHDVYRFPDGRIYTLAHTGSDRRQWNNALSDLKKMLGLTRGEAKVGERRERRVKTRARVPWQGFRPSGVMVAQKRAIGLESIYELLPARRSPIAPKWRGCYPMERELILRTPLQVILGKIFRL